MRFKNALAGLMTAGLATQASAALVFDLSESGQDLVLTASGSIITAGLTDLGDATTFGQIAVDAMVVADNGSPVRSYGATVTGPASTSVSYFAFTLSPLSGDAVGFLTRGVPPGTLEIVLPRGYVSGNPLFGRQTHPGVTFAAIAATPGTTVTWTWGSGASADAITLNIGTVTPVPEPGTWALMAAGLGLVAFGARRRQARAA